MNEVEDTRLGEFRQLKKEIRGSKEYLVVGIDVAKEKHHAFFGTATGKTLVRRLIFDNTIEGFEKLLTQVRAIQVAQGLPKVVFGLEPTANYHKPLGEHLIKCGRMVVLVSGVAVKHNRELLDGRWDKHNTKDSANIADLISQGKCLFQNRKQVLKMAGLDLSADRSGKTSDSVTRLFLLNLHSPRIHRRRLSIFSFAPIFHLPSLWIEDWGWIGRDAGDLG